MKELEWNTMDWMERNVPRRRLTPEVLVRGEGGGGGVTGGTGDGMWNGIDGVVLV